MEQLSGHVVRRDQPLAIELVSTLPRPRRRHRGRRWPPRRDSRPGWASTPSRLSGASAPSTRPRRSIGCGTCGTPSTACSAPSSRNGRRPPTTCEAVNAAARGAAEPDRELRWPRGGALHAVDVDRPPGRPTRSWLGWRPTPSQWWRGSGASSAPAAARAASCCSYGPGPARRGARRPAATAPGWPATTAGPARGDAPSGRSGQHGQQSLVGQRPVVHELVRPLRRAAGHGRRLRSPCAPCSSRMFRGGGKYSSSSVTRSSSTPGGAPGGR